MNCLQICMAKIFKINPPTCIFFVSYYNHFSFILCFSVILYSSFLLFFPSSLCVLSLPFSYSLSLLRFCRTNPKKSIPPSFIYLATTLPSTVQLRCTFLFPFSFSLALSFLTRTLLFLTSFLFQYFSFPVSAFFLFPYLSLFLSLSPSCTLSLSLSLCF